jgi:mRNA-degrading endonuclease toxin of MazEF toxin-antitoxin module
MQRGNVWWVSFEPSVGGEIRKQRPAVFGVPETSATRLGIAV